MLCGDRDEIVNHIISEYSYLKVVKSILWTVIGCSPSEWVYQCIYIPACFNHVTG